MSISALQGQGYDDSLDSKHNHYTIPPLTQWVTYSPNLKGG